MDWRTRCNTRSPTAGCGRATGSPQRDFAGHAPHRPSTAIRVYAELTRRGLVVGEVGRGTFVRTGPPLEGFSLAQGIGGLINLATNVPLLPNQAARLMCRRHA